MNKKVASENKQIALKKLELLYRQSRASAVLSIAIACLLLGIVWQQLPALYSLSWIALITLLSILRVSLSISFFRHRPGVDKVPLWQGYYFVSLIGIAVLWGLGCTLMMYWLDPVLQGIVYFFLMGMGGGFLVAHSVNRIHIITFMPLLLGPSIVFAALEGSWVIKLTGVTTFIFMLAGINASEILSRMLHQNFLLTEELHDAKRVAENLANIDPLTNLNNRRAFLNFSSQQLKLCVRREIPTALIMADVDNFKSINDNYGHDVGDKALIFIANLMNESRRESDICARLGGEEFVILLTGSDTISAEQYAEKLRAKIQENPLVLGGTVLKLSISIGIASESNDIEQLLRLADKAMYQAKRQGKNQVVTMSESA